MILLIGDSISEGYGVDDTSTFAYKMELINQNLEIINASVGGYNTFQEQIVFLNMLRNLTLKLFCYIFSLMIFIILN